MAYKCPLCLKELSVNDTLIRYCYKCDHADFVKGNAENLRNNLKCKKTFCKSHGLIEEGVYFAHLNCEKLNPFWNEDQLNVPDYASIDGKQITLPFEDELDNVDEVTLNSFKSFKHWQINLLSKTINSKAQAGSANETRNISAVREMWFPGILLRSTDERRLGKKLGQIVALVGTKGAGKTFLALQSLDREGYIHPFVNEHIEVEDYIYSHRSQKSTIQPIFELLRLRYFMRANRPFPPLQGTVRETVNFYAAFFSPTKAILQKKQTAQENSQTNSIEQAKSVWEKTKGILKKWFAVPTNSKKPFFFTLALYDVAGEDVEKEVAQIATIKNGVDKIALVIDAEDLEIKAEEKVALAEHLDGLRNLKNISDKAFCVVLTKMDLFAQYLRTHPAFNYEVERNREDFYDGNQTTVKDLLKNWKQTVAVNSSDDLPINLLSLLDELIALDVKNPIFMIETQNLPTDPRAIISKQPFSRGIDTFVCWCLEIERSEIIETKIIETN